MVLPKSHQPPPLLIKNERCLNNSNITFTLRWFDTVFSGPNLAFSIGVLSTSLSSDQCGNYTSTFKKIEVWLNVFFKVMGISMETINQKYENRQSMNFVLNRSVIENLIPISEITMCGKWNMQE